MQTTQLDVAQLGMMIVAAREGAQRDWSRDDARSFAIFGPNADPRLAPKLFREDFVEYRRLKRVADMLQSNRG